MIGHAAMAVGLVLIVEGLAYALAPSLVERLLEAMRAMAEDQRRVLGLGALAAGVLLVWVAKMLGA
ncbi:hypothetical protein GCM10011360_21170 [Primorskyibacter flagellatus]|uniref:DUF2065 domain-containing protein n=1 Tax=Primorskyibacter flagellatus TaxID=1387277 RepID=A0A917EFE3_9RHOB|nr:DUF2065 domain-containing protein [Primorskyibacter flagellatus]GGE33055.1 hypothetical protein GCM10011360_21170 [Primorskyibacter flagellatus]